MAKSKSKSTLRKSMRKSKRKSTMRKSTMRKSMRKSALRKSNRRKRRVSSKRGQMGGSPAYRLHQQQGFLSGTNPHARNIPLCQPGNKSVEQPIYQVSV
jgi:hypothetical protein